VPIHAGMGMICGRCLTVGEPTAVRRKNRGDAGVGCASMVVGVIGLFLWPLLILAGVLFLAAIAIAVKNQAVAAGVQHWECRACKAEAMVPLDSPAGLQLQAQSRNLLSS
jgi:hypothetical protein